MGCRPWRDFIISRPMMFCEGLQQKWGPALASHCGPRVLDCAIPCPIYNWLAAARHSAVGSPSPPPRRSFLRQASQFTISLGTLGAGSGLGLADFAFAKGPAPIATNI